MKPDKIPTFIADINVGKLARWLRVLGYDTLLFRGKNDADMVTAALAEDRILLSRDSRLMERKLITRGQISAILIKSGDVREQLKQVLESVKRLPTPIPLSRCLEDNEPLVAKIKEEVRECVPAYVFQTQNEYTECPVCCRIYWKGTHWQAIIEKLSELKTNV
jgi:uncharacterized protein with PIN domain